MYCRNLKIYVYIYLYIDGFRILCIRYCYFWSFNGYGCYGMLFTFIKATLVNDFI